MQRGLLAFLCTLLLRAALGSMQLKQHLPNVGKKYGVVYGTAYGPGIIAKPVYISLCDGIVNSLCPHFFNTFSKPLGCLISLTYVCVYLYLSINLIYKKTTHQIMSHFIPQPFNNMLCAAGFGFQRKH